MRPMKILMLLLMLLPLLSLCGCEEDSINKPGENGDNGSDTTPPQVTGVSPADGEVGVDVDAPIVITFSEAIAGTDLASRFSCTPGGIAAATLTQPNIVTLTHADWSQGTEITVTISQNLADTSGNTLGEAFTFSFWTSTDEVLLLNSIPADDAVGVDRNTTVRLQFSAVMDSTTLHDATTVSSPGKAAHPFTLDVDWEWATLTFLNDLPADTRIDVAITTDAESEYAEPLSAPAAFGFTTSSGLDTTPPSLLSLEPASGSTIPTDQPYLRLTFSEAIDDASLEPSWFSGAFGLEVIMQESEPVWTEGGTVMTVPLNGSLPAGAILGVGFDTFEDMNGNPSTAGFEWEATVAGTPDYYPLIDGNEYMMFGEMTYTYPDPDKLEETTPWAIWEKFVLRPDDVFWVQNAHGALRTDMQYEYWDIFSHDATGIDLLGEHEPDREDPESSGIDYYYDTPVDYLHLPVAPGEWSGASSFTPDKSYGISYTARVLATVITLTLMMPNFGDFAEDGFWIDLIRNKDDVMPEIRWPDCRVFETDVTITVGGNTVQRIQETRYLAPGIGVAGYDSDTDDYDQEGAFSSSLEFGVIRVPLDE